MAMQEETESRAWAALPAELAAVSADLARTFATERAALPAGLSHRVMLALPRPVTAATRGARILAGLVLLGAGGVLALCWQWLAFRAEDLSLSEMLLPTLGGLLVLMAVLSAFTLPATAWWRWLRRADVSWRETAARDAYWVFGHRVAATGMLALAAHLFLA